MRARSLLLWVVAGLWLAAGAARADEVDRALERLSAANARTRTLQARFTQRKQMALFRTEVVTKGRLLYRRPDHLRWETFAPDASVLVVTGRQAVLRLPDTPPRQIDLREGGTMAALVDQMLTWLGARPAAELRERYRISAREGSSGTELSLTPKGGALAESITRIRLQLGPDDLLRSVMVRQKSGDTTTITFADVQRNKPLPDGTFR